MAFNHNTLVGCESQEFVVVHDRVHGLDPIRVEVTVEEDPLGVGVRSIGKLAHQAAEDTVLPLARSQIHVAVEVCGQDGLGIEISNLTFISLLNACI